MRSNSPPHWKNVGALPLAVAGTQQAGEFVRVASYPLPSQAGSATDMADFRCLAIQHNQQAIPKAHGFDDDHVARLAGLESTIACKARVTRQDVADGPVRSTGSRQTAAASTNATGESRLADLLLAPRTLSKSVLVGSLARHRALNCQRLLNQLAGAGTRDKLATKPAVAGYRTGGELFDRRQAAIGGRLPGDTSARRFRDQ